LSTAFYVMGTEGARDYCARHSEVRAIVVENSGNGELRPMHIGTN